MAEDNDNKPKYLKYVVVVLGVVLVALLVLFVREVIHLKRLELIDKQKVELSNFLESHSPLTADAVNVITSWMTFDYINKLFRLPPEYLRTELSISDSRYPQLSVYAYSRSDHVSAATAVAEIETAVHAYLVNQSTPKQ